MMHITLYEGNGDVHFTINGAHISRSKSVNNGPKQDHTDLRGDAGRGNWYDEPHQKVMEAVYALEAALKELGS